MLEIFFFISTFAVSLVLTYVIKILATKFNLTDKPDGQRKKHVRAIPLGGGLAIFLAFFINLFFVRDYLLAGDLQALHWLGFFIGALFLILGGILDDKFNLKVCYQLLFPILAVLAVIVGGINVEKISNPLGAYFYLDNFKILLFSRNGVNYFFTVASDTIILVWLFSMMYTTKLLDGVDGLVSGVSAIGALIIFLFTMSDQYYQGDIALAALILCAAILGFLFFNWHPAKIFLGEGGSLFLGYALGVLAVISGGKIAIALLVMGIPLLDLFWTIVRRLWAGKNPFSSADRGHLHFKLLDSGLGAKKTVLIYYFLSALFGFSALFLQSRGKLYALILLVFVMLMFVIGFWFWDKKRRNAYE